MIYIRVTGFDVFYYREIYKGLILPTSLLINRMNERGYGWL